MKKLIISFVLLSITLSSFSQQIPDSAYLQITYLEDFVRNIDNPKKKTLDELVLNIGKFSSEFYSLREDRVKQITDSILKSGKNAYDVREAISEYPRSHQKYRVYKNVPSIGELSYINQILAYYQYKENLEKPVWELLSTKKEIQGYMCQKAVTNFKGRKWTAWYTNDIPISDGPWKLCGLPGLILDAVDSDSLYHFYCVGIKELKHKTQIKILKEKYVMCTKQKLYKISKESKENLIGYLKSQPGIISVRATEADGRPAKPNITKYIDMEAEPTKKIE